MQVMGNIRLVVASALQGIRTLLHRHKIARPRLLLGCLRPRLSPTELVAGTCSLQAAEISESGWPVLLEVCCTVADQREPFIDMRDCFWTV